MEYIKIIRRIVYLQSGYIRACELANKLYPEQDINLDFQIYDKLQLLKQQLRGWIYEPETHENIRCRRNQVKLACRYLNVDFYTLL